MVKEVVWRWDYGVYVPFCPYCDEPAYEHDRCFACGKAYKWVDGEYQPKTVSRGEYTVTQATNNHVTITKNGRMVFHAQCNEPKTNDELLGMIDFFESMCNDREGWGMNDGQEKNH